MSKQKLFALRGELNPARTSSMDEEEFDAHLDSLTEQVQSLKSKPKKKKQSKPKQAELGIDREEKGGEDRSEDSSD